MLLNLILSVVSFFIQETVSKYLPNNSCKNYIDYYFINTSKNCYYNSEFFEQTAKIIEKHIGFSETYNVTTEDGYILTLFRIPRQRPKGVAILQHPVTTDSIVWVGQSNESLAFLLWSFGYDIWLPNHRGTYFSRKHVNLTTSDAKFWDFSFHEIGLFDYKTIIDFVKMKTGSKIVFISHSMSTTASLIYSSLRPKEAKDSVKVFISMSPVCYLKHVRSPVKYLAYFTPYLKMINTLLHITHLYEYDSPLMQTLRLLMLELPFKYLATVMISLFQGWTPQEFDPAFINLSISHHPRSYSWKIFYHYVQQYLSGGRFQMYDYGPNINKKIYGSLIPPEYPIEKIITPTYLIYSKHDSIATSEDSELLYDKLNEKAKVYGKLEIKNINHVDFHYGKHRKEKVFHEIIKLLKLIEHNF
ncbi:lipase member K-like isoform X1 [Tribolium madens]|uniref:lipase member K-like isoform X1 n=1 Tax=Tribolium madens TaxID=41895 RepID=UPI001CF7332F|nr:lipase member K-like isoform X1 [Tribolium madens]